CSTPKPLCRRQPGLIRAPKRIVQGRLGIWLAARRLNKGRFIWTNGEHAIATALNPEQLRALVTGLPWQTLTHDHAITVV
ncbi:IS66 family insertion sequence element accessory protein TnpB, partial [Burkholderia ubonensis]|uniref:IS66 family insertion sequence element accessory protein TnpB n=1 Tax=Burkholderia ubonensis TaxID=101571 RepID=UPI000A618A53